MGTTANERSMTMRPEYESSLLRRPEEARLVRSDVFVHELEQGTLETLREAMGRGLTPSSFDFDGDILILRLERNKEAE
jgi:hypothetical protein